MSNSPSISAVICTRNRGASVVATIETILANTHPNFEVLLIDQSTNQETEQAITPFRTDSRFQYVHSATQGLGRARNIGISLAHGPLVAFTDDDCTVPPTWLATIAAIFAKQPRIAVVFCNVEPAEHDRTAGYIPVYVRSEDKLVQSYWDKCHARGIGAGMAVRRSDMLDMGGFDEYLGAGSRFPSGEDLDIAVRALAHGRWVYETHAVTVIHDGFRTWEQLRALTKRDWVGIGAAYAKLMACYQWGGIVVILHEALITGFLKPFSEVFRLRKPHGIRRVVYFVIGFIAGLQTPVDRKHMIYKSADGSVQSRLLADSETIQGYNVQ